MTSKILFRNLKISFFLSEKPQQHSVVSSFLLSFVDSKRMSDEECLPISISEKKPRFTMTKYLPVFRWLPRYTRFKAVSDLIAGITLGLTMIPQSMAYAVLAERIPQVLQFRSLFLLFVLIKTKFNDYKT